MISKLVMQKLTIAGKEYEYPDTTALVGKINELADAVNGILDYAPLEMAMKAEPEPADQCEWLGKLCKFWDGDEQISHLRWGILYSITPTSPLPFCCSLGNGKTFDYEHCEPVKPDDDIIYKGGDNER